MNANTLVAVLLGAALAGCVECKLTPAKYMCVAPPPALLPSDTPGGYGVYEQASCMAPDAADQMLRIVAETLQDNGIVKTAAEFTAFIAAEPPVVEWMPDPATFSCGSVKKAAGCTRSVGLLQVLVSDCVAHSALGHELVHIWLMRTSMPDGDPEHSAPVWGAEGTWIARGHHALCVASNP